jgi:hypothetical protein
MRQFGSPISAERRHEIQERAEAVFAGASRVRSVPASQFELEAPGDPVVVHEAEVRFGEDRLRVGKSVPAFRPPFEWLLEITSNVGEADYFKHYLILEDQIVLAQRKVLTPIDEAEARVVLADLEAARRSLGND